MAQGEVVTWSSQLHDELRRQATAYLAKQPPGYTLRAARRARCPRSRELQFSVADGDPFDLDLANDVTFNIMVE